ncbi:MAG: sugar phosphate nucleotidyltransferase [Fidelibacterota bacterium]
MKVIIPIAGLGTRLLPHTIKRQKCLLPVAGKPVIDHILEPLVWGNFDPIVLITGHLEDQVRDHVKKYDARFEFVRQPDPLGLGHAVFLGLENTDEPAMIQLGDVIYHLDFGDFCHSPHHRLAVDTVPDPQRFGVVETEGDRVVKLYEKPEHPPTNLAVIGLYYISNQRVLWEAINDLLHRGIKTRGEIQLTDAFGKMVSDGESIGFTRVSEWFDCGIPETFLSSNRRLLSPSGLRIESSEIVDPVSIGKDCKIVNSTVGPHVTLMDGCRISDSTIADAIVLWNARLDGTRVLHAIVEEGDPAGGEVQ